MMRSILGIAELVAAAIFIFAAIGWAADEPLPNDPLPNDPRVGARLFQEKRCSYCHSIGEDIQKLGPNLSRVHERGSLLDVAAEIWNHAPTMIQKMRDLRIPWPELSGPEMANVIAFLSANQYYLQHLGKPGDREKGKVVFEKKQCGRCHSLELEADFEKVGPSLRGYARLSPVQIAQAMWNHGPAMFEQFRKLNITPPLFENNEVADLVSYLQATALPANSQPSYIEPGDPNRGRELFEKKGCTQCHAVRGVGGSSYAPDLGNLPKDLVRGTADVAAIMWNHAAKMWAKMEEHHISISKFENHEMADVIDYLFFINYFDKAGDISRGKELFVKKSCSQCHDVVGTGESIGPDLREALELGSPIDIVAAIWVHAPKIEQAARKKGIEWPTFQQGEMADLTEYLRTIVKNKTQR